WDSRWRRRGGRDRQAEIDRLKQRAARAQESHLYEHSVVSLLIGLFDPGIPVGHGWVLRDSVTNDGCSGTLGTGCWLCGSGWTNRSCAWNSRRDWGCSDRRAAGGPNTGRCARLVRLGRITWLGQGSATRLRG